MSQQVTDAELAILEYGQIDLQARMKAKTLQTSVKKLQMISRE